MATNKAFMTFGFLAVLLLSVGFAFANVDNFNLIIDGEGNSSDNRITAENGTTKTLSLVLNHDNTTFEKVQINWSGGRGFLILPENGLFSTGNHIFLLSIIMPDEVVDSTRILTATLYNSSNLTEELGEEKVTIFYNSTLPVVEEEEPTTESKFPICKKVGDLKISDFTVNNFGVGDDEEWEPLDELEIEVEIENRNKDDDVRDVLVQITILDSDNNDLDVTRDFDLENEEIDLGKINDDDDEIATFRIRELPGDIEDGNFKMVFHVFSEDNEANQCVSESTRFEGESIFYSEFEVVREDNDAVILKSPRNIEDIKILASCGEDSVEVSFKIYNVGVDKEKHTLVTLFNSVLGINERLVVDNLREGKNK
ncbi:MAG: putative S-layer protein, partial [Nanoarchaeota archaeon]|nr:putative S-layer protein [Nanoarchaeota archaeon]